MCPSKEHEDAVDYLAKTHSMVRGNGFSNRLRTIFQECPEFLESVADITVIPDLYTVDLDNYLVYIIEVEKTHPLTERKMKLYGLIADALDAEGWGFTVQCVFTYRRELHWDAPQNALSWFYQYFIIPGSKKLKSKETFFSADFIERLRNLGEGDD